MTFNFFSGRLLFSIGCLWIFDKYKYLYCCHGLQSHLTNFTFTHRVLPQSAFVVVQQKSSNCGINQSIDQKKLAACIAICIGVRTKKILYVIMTLYIFMDSSQISINQSTNCTKGHVHKHNLHVYLNLPLEFYQIK